MTEKSASKIPTATWLPPLLSEKTGFEIHTSGAYVTPPEWASLLLHHQTDPNPLHSYGIQEKFN